MKTFITIISLLSLNLTAVSQANFRNLNPRSAMYEDSIPNPYPQKTDATGKSPFTKLDSVYYYDWISGTNWQQQQSDLHYYDALINDSLIIIRAWSSVSGLWVDQIRYERSFNFQGQILEQVRKIRNGGWTNHIKTSYTYKTNGWLDHYLVQLWNQGTQSWNDLIRYSYNFDNEGNWIYYLRQNWNQDSLKWLNVYRFDYTYVNGLKTEFIRRDWKTDVYDWENNNRFLYSYVGSFLKQEFGEVWDRDSSKWDPNTLIDYLRDLDGNITDKTYQARNAQGWYNTVTYSYEYNSQQLNTGINYYTWDTESLVWKENARYEYDYNGYGDLILEVWKLWDAAGTAWENDYRIEYYHSSTDVALTTNAFSNRISIYPNPVRETFFISFDREPGHSIAIEIMDGLGRIVYTGKLEQRVTSISNFRAPRGIYLLRIYSGAQGAIMKILKL